MLIFITSSIRWTSISVIERMAMIFELGLLDQKDNPKYLRKRNLSIRGGQIKTPAKLIFLVANKTFALKGSVILSNVGDEIFKRWTIFWQTYFRGFCQIWGFRAAILYPSQFFFLSQLSIVSCCIWLFSMK